MDYRKLVVKTHQEYLSLYFEHNHCPESLVLDDDREVNLLIKETLDLYNKGQDDAGSLAAYILLSKNKDPKKALNILKELSERDNPTSFYLLGECYRLGRGVDKDIAASIKFYKKAAEYNEPKSLTRLGIKQN